MVLSGLSVLKESSSLEVLAGSVMDGLERVVPRDDLEPFKDGLIDTAEAEMLESREGGGGWSEKVGASGDCSLEDDTETITGEVMAVPAGLFVGGGFVAGLLLGPVPAATLSSEWSMNWSLLAPTEAFSRLYSPLRPPCIISKLLASLVADAGGGEVRSSKVVKASERDAVAWIWWSGLGSRREPRAMGIRGKQKLGVYRCSGGTGTAAGRSGMWRASGVVSTVREVVAREEGWHVWHVRVGGRATVGRRNRSATDNGPQRAARGMLRARGGTQLETRLPGGCDGCGG